MTDNTELGEQEAARRWRAERRRILRELHPDRGGDPAAYLAAVSAMGTRCGGSPAAAAASAPTRGSATMSQILRRHWRQKLTSAQVRLPRRWPGARRYAQL